MEKIKQVSHDGDVWNVVSEGSVKGDKTLCHLASTTRGNYQKNGFYPIQMMDLIPNELLGD